MFPGNFKEFVRPLVRLAICRAPWVSNAKPTSTTWPAARIRRCAMFCSRFACRPMTAVTTPATAVALTKRTMGNRASRRMVFVITVAPSRTTKRECPSPAISICPTRVLIPACVSPLASTIPPRHQSSFLLCIVFPIPMRETATATHPGVKTKQTTGVQGSKWRAFATTAAQHQSTLRASHPPAIMICQTTSTIRGIASPWATRRIQTQRFLTTACPKTVRAVLLATCSPWRVRSASTATGPVLTAITKLAPWVRVGVAKRKNNSFC